MAVPKLLRPGPREEVSTGGVALPQRNWFYRLLCAHQHRVHFTRERELCPPHSGMSYKLLSYGWACFHCGGIVKEDKA